MFWSGKEENEEFEAAMAEVIHSGDLVLDVGCGSLKVDPSVVGVDAYEEGPMVNVKAFMWDMPFGDNTVDGIICMSALEHISKYQVLPTLAEFNRVLKVGAKFIILVPDLLWVMNEFMNNPNVDWEMDMIFGTQTHDGQYHKTGFTEDIFHKYFEEAIPNGEILDIFKVNAYHQLNLGVVAKKTHGDDWISSKDKA